MKYLFFCMLALSCLNTLAQQKFSVDAEFEGGPVLSRSKSRDTYSRGTYVYNYNTGIITYMPGNYRYTNEYKNEFTPQLTVGIKANYTFKQNFKIYAGVSFSYLDVKRKNILIIPNPFSNSSEKFEFVTKESFKFYNINFPLGVSYTYHKWSLNLGVIESVIVNSKFYEMNENTDDPPEIQPYYPWTNDPTYPRPSSVNKAKNYISLSISPSYQLNSRLRIGLQYNHGLTKSYYADNYSSEYYQSMKTSSLGLKILYKLK